MNKITLETLLADFEARKAFLTEQYGAVFTQKQHTIEVATTCPSNVSSRAVMKAVNDFVKARQLYVIARDEGLQAAMLWKLANG